MTTHETISAVCIFAGCQDVHSFVFGSGFCHLCSLWKIRLPPRLRLEACRSMCRRTANFFGGLLVLRTGFRYRIDWVPKGMSNEHSCSDRIFCGFYCSTSPGRGISVGCNACRRSPAIHGHRLLT